MLLFNRIFRLSKIDRVLILVILAFGWLTGCKKFVDAGIPKNKIPAVEVFANENTASAAITGVYSRMAEADFASGDARSITLLSGYSSDEFDNFYSEYQVFVRNNLVASNSTLSSSIWNKAYQIIYSCNAIIEGLNISDAVSANAKDQIIGEAKFIRAFCCLYLTNLFGDIPLQLTTDYRLNATAVRTASKEVYQQIVRDLKEADSLLPASIIGAGRTRVSRYAAKALLSRTYLYLEEWTKAEEAASYVINAVPVLTIEPDLDQVFLKDSKETIWQLMPVKPGYNTNEGNLFILQNHPLRVSMSDNLWNSFENNDARKDKWCGELVLPGVTYHYPFKYKVSSGAIVSEYSVVLRLAEQYLIRAEARIHQTEKISDGISDINVIRNRASKPAPENMAVLPLTLSKEEALMALEQERRVELFAEWGHRWFDLKRLNRVQEVLSVYKGADWQSSDALYPIPQAEINNNKNIVQNEGYN